MTTQSITIAEHRFGYGFYRQVWWNWLIGTAFFCGGLGREKRQHTGTLPAVLRGRHTRLTKQRLLSFGMSVRIFHTDA